jgi:hypothetical protein
MRERLGEPEGAHGGTLVPPRLNVDIDEDGKTVGLF